MIRRLRLLAATFIALYCSSALGVGLGELELRSALNQRFDAEIVLTNVEGLELDEILPNLASQADFDRVGVDRNYELTDLRFKVRVREDGQYVVSVTSSRAIIEPFLNFIVEIIWPTGRILREYTVLLDPPVFGTDGVEKIDPSMMGSQPTTSSGRQQRRQIPVAPQVSTGRTEGVVTQDDEYGITGPGDTLWSIALKVRPNNNVSVQQTMLALQRANPEAFINNNINLLKAGHVLRIPDMDEIRAETVEDAIAEVRIQNDEFDEYKGRDVTQMDARRTAARETTTDTAADDGELRLLASDQTDGARSGADDARVADLENALSVAREDLDRARRANTELNVRLDDLAGQVETLNEIVTLKDDQLAALRAELQRMQTAGTQAAPPPVVQQQAQPSLLSNPLVLGGLGVVLIGGIAAALILLRKRRQAAELDDEGFDDVLMAAEPEAAEEEVEAGEEAAEGEGEEDEDVTQQTSDVIGEAEIYIAYGRFPQAISFLQNAIEAEPDRADIQLKLLEVYVQTEDATAFNLQLDQLKLLGDEDATNQAMALQGQIPGAAETSAAAMDATIVSSEPIEAIAEPADDDDDLSFDLDADDDLDLGDSLDDAEEMDLDLEEDAGEELTLDEQMELGDAELDLDLDSALEEAAEEEAPAEEDDGLNLDLDSDLDLDLGGDDGEDMDATVDLGDDLDLDLGDDDDDALDLGDLDTGDDDDALDLGDLDTGDDDDALDLGDLDTGDDDDALDLGDLDTGDDDDALDLGDLDTGDDDDALDLGDLDTGDDDDALDLGDLDTGNDDDTLDLGDLDVGDDDDDLGLDLDDDLELDLGDDDGESKLDLARAYIEMGDNDGAKSLLQEVVAEGSDAEVSEANQLLEGLD